MACFSLTPVWLDRAFFRGRRYSLGRPCAGAGGRARERTSTRARRASSSFLEPAATTDVVLPSDDDDDRGRVINIEDAIDCLVGDCWIIFEEYVVMFSEVGKKCVRNSLFCIAHATFVLHQRRVYLEARATGPKTL